MLTIDEKQRYLEEVIVPNFYPLIEQKIHSVIFDFNLALLICTTRSANSIGLSTWQEAIGLSFNNHQNEDLPNNIFTTQYKGTSIEYINQYTKKIYEIQRKVLKKKVISCFIDLLPYKGKFQAYLVTYVPIFHPNGEVIAIQSHARLSRFFSHHEYLHHLMKNELGQREHNLEKLTTRESKIMFLLANGFSQDLIAQTLEVSRSTIANIIGNQLCAKFGISGSNTRLLAQKALQYELHHTVPISLYRPYVIILDDN